MNNKNNFLFGIYFLLSLACFSQSTIKVCFDNDNHLMSLNSNFKFYYYENGKKISPKIVKDCVYLKFNTSDAPASKIIAVCFEFGQTKVRFDNVNKNTLSGMWTFNYIKHASDSFIADGAEEVNNSPFYYVSIIRKDLKQIEYWNGTTYR